MAQSYASTEQKKPKKIIIIFGLLVVILVVFISIALMGGNDREVTKDESDAYAYIFISQIRARRYDSAYEMVRKNQFEKSAFDTLFRNFNQTVNFQKCRSNETTSPSIVVMECPYRTQGSKEKITIRFSVVKQNNKIAIDYFSITE